MTSEVLDETHVAVAGADHRDTVVLLPGRHANAAVSTPLVTTLAHRYRVVVVDLPGEAGLSSGGRPNTARLREYGSWLNELLPQLADRPVHLLGHGFGAALALTATPSPRVAGLVLMNPAGLAWPALNLGLLAAGARWRLCPTEDSSRRLLAHLWGSGGGVPDELVEWMQVVGRHVRWSSTPPPPPAEVVARWSTTPCIVATGEHDPVFPPDRLTAATRGLLGARLVSIPGAGHLLPYEQPAAVLDLLAQQRHHSPYGTVGDLAGQHREEITSTSTVRFMTRLAAATGSRPGRRLSQPGQRRPVRSNTPTPSGRSATKHGASAGFVPVATMSGLDPTARRTSPNSDSKGARAGSGGTPTGRSSPDPPGLPP